MSPWLIVLGTITVLAAVVAAASIAVLLDLRRGHYCPPARRRMENDPCPACGFDSRARGTTIGGVKW